MTELINLEVEEVSLVNAGANPEANILLFKRKEEKNMADKNTATADLERERAELAKAQETVQKLIGTLQEHVAKVEDAEALAIAKKYEILGHKAEDLAKQLKSLKPYPELYKSLIQSFDSALAAVEKTRAFEEIGKSGFGEGVLQIEKVAQENQAKEPNLTWWQAVDKAYQAHPELKF